MVKPNLHKITGLKDVNEYDFRNGSPEDRYNHLSALQRSGIIKCPNCMGMCIIQWSQFQCMSERCTRRGERYPLSYYPKWVEQFIEDSTLQEKIK